MYLFSQKGMYHKQNDEVCGDVVRGLDNGDFAVLVIADGVSTCSFGSEGASIVSSCALEYLQYQFERLHTLPKEWVNFLLKSVLERLSVVAKLHNSSVEEFSSTLLVSVVDKVRNELYYCNIGDGMLLSVENEKCPILSMPQGDGFFCPVTTTRNVLQVVDSGRKNLDEVSRVVMCTDGAWRKMYNRYTMKTEVKKQLLKNDINEFASYMQTATDVDDSSFAIVDVGG